MQKSNKSEVELKGNYGLAITMKVGGQILIGDDIVITIKKYTSSQLRVAIKAPKHLKINKRDIAEENNIDVKSKPEVLPKIKY